MFIRAFFKAETKAEAETHLNQLLVLAETIYLKLEVVNIEPYWKINDYFQVEIDGTNPTKEQLSQFLKDIAINWNSYPDSYLANNNIEGCTILIANLEFIEISPTE